MTMYYPNNYHPREARPTRPRKRSLLKEFFMVLWQTLVASFAVSGLFGIVAGAWMINVGAINLPYVLSFADHNGSKPLPSNGSSRLMSAVESLGIPAAEQRRPVIYLNREGGVLTAGHDDSSRNVSSVVANAGLERYEAPAFRASPVRWNSIMSCVEEQFADFDVDVVDQRPIEGDYVMVMVGGSSAELAARTGHSPSSRNSRITGLAPMGLAPNFDAIVYVFAREMNERTRDTCETVAEEVGHAFGLDHVLDCHDPMTHLPSCGRRSFQDRDTICGEHTARSCHTGAQTQNSYQHLLKILGPAPEGESATTERVASNRRSSGPRS